MKGKRGLVLGIANDRSIAYGIAQVAAAQGAELAVTYQIEPLAKRVVPLAQGLGASIIQLADAQKEEDLDTLFNAIQQKWGGLDFLVHCIAFSDKNELDGQYANTTRANFLNTMDISCFSFTNLARRSAALMNNGGSMLTLSYIGAERVVPHYNVMGVAKAALEASVRYLAVDLGGRNIRVNALSAGPIKTLAASGIGDFRYIMRWNEINAPLRKNVTQLEVGNMALFLLSDMGSGVTGEVIHVDAGYHTVGMVSVEGVDQLGNLLNDMKATKAAASGQ
ncbi:MAG: SDR family oxidoreductase [Proteobacteria bacterium]|nr:SDR family oxidoreductase [Pseudomonadota bacterium]